MVAPAKINSQTYRVSIYSPILVSSLLTPKYFQSISRTPPVLLARSSFAFRRPAEKQYSVGAVAQVLGWKRDGESRRALDDFEFPDQKTIIEANDRMGFDRSLLGSTDSNLRDLHGTELSLAQKSPKTHKRNADVRRGGQDHPSFYEQRVPVSQCENQEQQKTSQGFLV